MMKRKEGGEGRGKEKRMVGEWDRVRFVSFPERKRP